MYKRTSDFAGHGSANLNGLNKNCTVLPGVTSLINKMSKLKKKKSYFFISLGIPGVTNYLANIRCSDTYL